MAVVAGVPLGFFSLQLTPLKLAPRLAPCGGLAVAQPRAGPSWPLLPAFPQCFLSQTSLPLSLSLAWPRVTGSLWRNLGPARHGLCCRRSPCFFVSKFTPLELAPRLAPCDGLAVAQPRCCRSVRAVVAGIAPVSSLSNLTPLQLAPSLAPCGGLAVAQSPAGPSWPLLAAFPQFFLPQSSLPLSLLPAWPGLAGSLWRNLGPVRHGRSCRRSPSFISLKLHSPSACPLAWPRVAGWLWRNLGPARHCRCCWRSLSLFSLQLHSPRACSLLGPVWRARCCGIPGRDAMAVVAGVPPVLSLSNFTPLQLAPRLAPCGGLAVAQPRAGPSWPLFLAFPQSFLTPTSLTARVFPAWPRVAGSLLRNPGPGCHGRCCRRSLSFISSKLHSPRACHPLGPVWRARCGAAPGRPVMAVVAGVPPVLSLSNISPFELAPRLAPCGGLALAQPRCCRSVMAVVAGVPPVLSFSNFTPLELVPCLAPCGGLGVAQSRAGPSWPLLPAFPQVFFSPSPLPLSLSLAWPRVAGSLWRNLGPARHGRCCRRSPSFISLQHLSL